MKFRDCDPDPGESNQGTISNILYENIYMDQPSQWALWIGPAQQFIINSTCSLLWPQWDNLDYVECVGQPSLYENITLRNITIVDPLFPYVNLSYMSNRSMQKKIITLLRYGQGVILGTEQSPMKNLIFDGVRVIGAQNETFASYYKCEGVQDAVATGDTFPVPPCFQDQTSGSDFNSS